MFLTLVSILSSTTSATRLPRLITINIHASNLPTNKNQTSPIVNVSLLFLRGVAFSSGFHGDRVWDSCGHVCVRSGSENPEEFKIARNPKHDHRVERERS